MCKEESGISDSVEAKQGFHQCLGTLFVPREYPVSLPLSIISGQLIHRVEFILAHLLAEELITSQIFNNASEVWRWTL